MVQNLRNQYEIREHVGAVHLKLSEYKCDKCGRSFTQKSNLRSHYRALHEVRSEFDGNSNRKVANGTNLVRIWLTIKD